MHREVEDLDVGPRHSGFLLLGPHLTGLTLRHGLRDVVVRGVEAPLLHGGEVAPDGVLGAPRFERQRPADEQRTRECQPWASRSNAAHVSR